MVFIQRLGGKLCAHSMQIRKTHQGAVGQLHEGATRTIKLYGQPTSDTHPHLISRGFVLPNISSDELWARREKVSRLVLEAAKKRHSSCQSHVLVIPSASKVYMSEKIPYVFRQNSDFLYLSGCLEPDTCLVINVKDETKHKATLFMRERDPHSEIWDGPRTDPSEACHLFGVDQALPLRDLFSYLGKEFAKSPTALWYDSSSNIQESVASAVKSYLSTSRTKILDSPKGLLHKVRLIKSKAEIDLMKQSCDIASEAFIQCMRASKPDIREHELFAIMDFESRLRGAEYLAYPPVVAGGERATIIHYINNNQVVRDGEMVLMDAGCEYHGYSSDITRVWPVNGTFSQAQKTLYEVVLGVQKHIIDKLNTSCTLDKLFEEMCLSLGKALQDVGVCNKSISIETTIRQAYQFCPHHVSHYLGMDVHDTALISRGIPIKNGMIITVEPGVYIQRSSNVPKEYQGLGIRIEDDVLITDDGPVVLSDKCPKSIDEIEAIMASR